jgi:hypothetical protein
MGDLMGMYNQQNIGDNFCVQTIHSWGTQGCRYSARQRMLSTRACCSPETDTVERLDTWKSWGKQEIYAIQRKYDSIFFGVYIMSDIPLFNIPLFKPTDAGHFCCDEIRCSRKASHLGKTCPSLLMKCTASLKYVYIDTYLCCTYVHNWS